MTLRYPKYLPGVLAPLLCVLLAAVAGAGCAHCKASPHRHVRLVSDASSGGMTRIETREARGWERTSRVVYAHSFDECILSWNVVSGPGCGVVFEARVRRVGVPHGWSPWLFMGEVGDPSRVMTQEPVAVWKDGRVAIDIIEGKTAFDAVQVRVRGACGDGAAAGIALERLDVVLTSTPRMERSLARHHDGRHEQGKAIRLDVPFLSQRTSDPSLAGRLCSPTSVAMVLGYYGMGESVERVAAIALDPRHDIYGNWPRNVQAARECGVKGSVRRFAGWDEVRRTLEAGMPIIASIVVNKGELPGAPYESTDGHLIVVTGLTEDGDLYANDPACGDGAAGRLVYPRRAMERVWLRARKGTSYVLEGERVQWREAP